jgi:hypothetical protein
MGMEGKREIKESTIIQRKNDLLYSEIQDEIIALSVETGEYIGFNSVGSRIWSLIEFPVRFIDLVNTISKEFEVDPELAKTDAIHFLEKLKDKKLITVK